MGNSIPEVYLFSALPLYMSQRVRCCLSIDIQALLGGIIAVEAVSAVVSALQASYVQVTMSRPCDMDSLGRVHGQATSFRCNR